ncbi:hypothetical protein JCM18909_806 [Cutibacterium acnes JCM 18909]|nr:hypothetical protein JCM18909_806 [Cutibacterium acnes JCM 18909]
MDHRLRNVDRVERNAVSDATSAATAAQPIPGRWKALAVLAAGSPSSSWTAQSSVLPYRR